MNFLTNSNLCCPIDQLPLAQRNGSLACDNGHLFDVGKPGYVNLLAASDKRSKDPGDSKAMVAARRDFFDAGFYEPIAQQLAQCVTPMLGQSAVVVDAGCGEGYYLKYLQTELAAKHQAGASLGPSYIGFDISKWAVQAAAKRFPATWFVASNRNIPLADNSTDVLLSLFGFCAYSSFARIMKPKATLVLVSAGPKHLIELREIIYATVKESHSTELEHAAQAGFTLQRSLNVEYVTEPLGKLALTQLLGMTPHLFRASREGKEKLSELESLAVTVDVNFHLLAPPEE